MHLEIELEISAVLNSCLHFQKEQKPAFSLKPLGDSPFLPGFLRYASSMPSCRSALFGRYKSTGTAAEPWNIIRTLCGNTIAPGSRLIAVCGEE